MISKYRTKNCLILSVLLVSIPVQVFAHEWMAPASAAKMKNPVKFEKESVTQGELLFTENCAACHGENGTGLKPEISGLQKSTPDLTKRLTNHSDGDFFWKIQNGRGEMPPFKESLSDMEIWHIVNFIKSKSKTPEL